MELNSVQEKIDFSQKSTYTNEEKQYIIQQLNESRRKEQKAAQIRTDSKGMNEEEKQRILRSVNDKRLEAQLFHEMTERRIHNKMIYLFDMREFHKFLHMEREYFLELKDLKKITTRPQILTLYFRTFGELKKKDFLIKIQNYSDKIFISTDVLRVYFKGYSLENEQCNIENEQR